MYFCCKHERQVNFDILIIEMFVKKVLDVFNVFNNVSYTLSSVYYPTTCLIITECINVIGALEKYINDNELKLTIKAMKTI